MHLLPWRNNGASSANRLYVRLHELPHDGRDLVVHLRQTTLLSRTAIIDFVLRCTTFRIQHVVSSSDVPVLWVQVSGEDFYDALITTNGP